MAKHTVFIHIHCHSFINLWSNFTLAYSTNIGSILCYKIVVYIKEFSFESTFAISNFDKIHSHPKRINTILIVRKEKKNTTKMSIIRIWKMKTKKKKKVCMFHALKQTDVNNAACLINGVCSVTERRRARVVIAMSFINR